MFIDLVDSTKLANRLDPEDLLSVTLTYQKAVGRVIAELEGHIARIVGDGIMAIFGWPTAHEDDPIRAMHAAIRIHDTLSQMKPAGGVQLECRIGVATGIVVVGDLESGTTSQDNAVFGDTPNLAARLQELTPPGGTFVSASSHRRIDKVFRCKSMGMHVLKGFDAPMEAFAVLGEGSPDPAVRDAGLTDLFGRRAQLETLMEKWSLACNGQGQIVSLWGDAGVGKTRLLQAQRELIRRDNYPVISYHCSMHRSESAFYPFVRDVEGRWRIDPDDDEQTRLGKIRARAGSILNDDQMALLEMVVTSSRLRDRALGEMSEQKFRKGIHDIFLTMIAEAAAKGPLLIQFEDIHWIDPSSQALLKAAQRRLADHPILLVLSHRPDSKANFLTGESVSRLQLDGLPTEDARAMVEACLGGRQLSTEKIDRIVDMTNGVPLFIEATVDAVKDGAAGPDDLLTVPGPLLDLLTAKLDRLDELRPIALASSAIGREFDVKLLSQIVEKSVEETSDAVTRLIQRDILKKAAGGLLGFHHNLLQEAAYAGLLRQQKADLHRHISTVLEADRGELASLEPEFLAYHHERAGNIHRAITYWFQAASNSLMRFAYVEAVSHARHSLTLLADLPESVGDTERDRLALKIHAVIGAANRALKGYGSAETLDAFQTAFELADRLGKDNAYLHAARGLFTAHQVLANFDQAGAYGRRVLAKSGDDQTRMIAHYMIGAPLIWQGQFVEAREALIEAERYGIAHMESMKGGTTDASVTNQVLALRAVVDAFLGDADAAIDRANLAIEQARQVDRPLTLANALLMSCNTHQILRHPNCMQAARDLEQLGREQRLPFYSASSISFVAVALYAEGEAQRGYDMLVDGWKAFQRTTSRANQVLVCTELAHGCLLLGRIEEGLAIVEEGISRIEKYDERNFEAELLRIHTRLLQSRGDAPDAIRAAYETSIAVATRQNARTFKDRAESDLADYLRATPDQTVQLT